MENKGSVSSLRVEGSVERGCNDERTRKEDTALDVLNVKDASNSNKSVRTSPDENTSSSQTEAEAITAETEKSRGFINRFMQLESQIGLLKSGGDEPAFRGVQVKTEPNWKEEFQTASNAGLCTSSDGNITPGLQNLETNKSDGSVLPGQNVEEVNAPDVGSAVKKDMVNGSFDTCNVAVKVEPVEELISSGGNMAGMNSGQPLMNYRGKNVEGGEVVCVNSSESEDSSSDSTTSTSDDSDDGEDVTDQMDAGAKLNKALSADRDQSPEGDRRVKLNKFGLEDIRTKGELLVEELPPIEDLQITVSETVEMVQLGHVSSIVGCLVIIQSKTDVAPLNDDTILFLEERKVLGQVFEVFGPVQMPWYTVRFNSPAEIEKKEIEVGQLVYCAPKETEFTNFVFVERVRQEKGSDASWEHNNEPPAKYLDFSDDEEERKASAKRRGKSVSNTEEKEGEQHGGSRKKPNRRQKNREEAEGRIVDTDRPEHPHRWPPRDKRPGNRHGDYNRQAQNPFMGARGQERQRSHHQNGRCSNENMQCFGGQRMNSPYGSQPEHFPGSPNSEMTRPQYRSQFGERQGFERPRFQFGGPPQFNNQGPRSFDTQGPRYGHHRNNQGPWRNVNNIDVHGHNSSNFVNRQGDSKGNNFHNCGPSPFNRGQGDQFSGENQQTQFSGPPPWAPQTNFGQSVGHSSSSSPNPFNYQQNSVYNNLSVGSQRDGEPPWTTHTCSINGQSSGPGKFSQSPGGPFQNNNRSQYTFPHSRTGDFQQGNTEQMCKSQYQYQGHGPNLEQGNGSFCLPNMQSAPFPQNMPRSVTPPVFNTSQPGLLQAPPPPPSEVPGSFVFGSNNCPTKGCVGPPFPGAGPFGAMTNRPTIDPRLIQNEHYNTNN